MKMFAPAFASLLLLASCERSRVDVMAASTDELATRCFDAVSDSTDPAWIAPHLGDDIAVAKHSDGFDIACPFTLRNGEVTAKLASGSVRPAAMAWPPYLLINVGCCAATTLRASRI